MERSSLAGWSSCTPREDGQQLRRFSPSLAEQHSVYRAEMFHSTSEESDLVSLCKHVLCSSNSKTFLSPTPLSFEQRGRAWSAGEWRVLMQDLKGHNHTSSVFLPVTFVER